jgi:hypothetical protein
MGRYLAPVPAVALACGRPESTIRSWILRYPDELPSHGTSHDGYALYDIDEAQTLARHLDEAHARGVPLATILTEHDPEGSP